MRLLHWIQFRRWLRTRDFNLSEIVSLLNCLKRDYYWPRYAYMLHIQFMPIDLQLKHWIKVGWGEIFFFCAHVRVLEVAISKLVTQKGALNILWKSTQYCMYTDLNDKMLKQLSLRAVPTQSVRNIYLQIIYFIRKTSMFCGSHLAHASGDQA